VIRALTLVSVLVAGAAHMPGCAAAAVLAVSAISAGAAAGEKGFSFWQSGRLYYVDEGSIEQMTDAVRLMIQRLDLTVRSERDIVDDGVLEARHWIIRTDHGHLLRLEVEPLTSALIAVELDTGAFGNKAAAELVAQRIKDELSAVRMGAEPRMNDN
jgi:hypothetical protein